MLHIFDQKDFQPQEPDKKQTLNRLQNVLAASPAVQRETSRPAPVAEAPVTARPAASSVPWERKGSEPRVAPPPPPPPLYREERKVTAREERKPTGPAPVERAPIADDLSRTFFEGIVRTFQEVQSLAADGRRETNALHEEVGLLSQRVEGLARSQSELAERIASLENAVRTLAEASHAVREAGERMDRRLELQAGVIRTLHNALQNKDERLEKLVSAFQGLQAISAAAGDIPPSLPDGL